ncbi:MAG: hypothetical protein R2764_01660 [Bacteroidales bacterium]
MKTSGKKVLYLTLKKEFFDLIKKGEKTSEFREYKSYWINRLMNSDGNFKQFDYIHFRNGYQKDARKIMIEFRGINVIKQKVGFLKTEKLFEIELGEVIK